MSGLIKEEVENDWGLIIWAEWTIFNQKEYPPPGLISDWKIGVHLWDCGNIFLVYIN